MAQNNYLLIKFFKVTPLGYINKPIKVSNCIVYRTRFFIIDRNNVINLVLKRPSVDCIVKKRNNILKNIAVGHNTVQPLQTGILVKP